ncbi:hypothetical protein BC826DRAFT_1190330 [Russula brevipes]|nr:hypothetical protein BC826DRAFT_1190330 [Russula brevipes]
MSNNHPPTIPKLRKILQAAAEGCSALDSGGNTTAQQREELQSILTAFLSTPCISKLTALPPQLPPHHKDEISEIKSSLNALSKSVNTLLQKASNRSNKPPSPPTAARAGESTSPTAPSYAKHPKSSKRPNYQVHKHPKSLKTFQASPSLPSPPSIPTPKSPKHPKPPQASQVPQAS